MSEGDIRHGGAGSIVSTDSETIGPSCDDENVVKLRDDDEVSSTTDGDKKRGSTKRHSNKNLAHSEGNDKYSDSDIEAGEASTLIEKSKGSLDERNGTYQFVTAIFVRHTWANKHALSGCKW